ncbi:ABCB family ABC transporter ATP-binding protein/permease [Bermanella sp. R86510]|uniref:ABCB family ABC transporter ATP-binding protein/permease n=1 Tax=unclassified Bermanella TaxID=2627862 RepID=UPI0037CC232F
MSSDFDPNKKIDWSIVKQMGPYLFEYRYRIALAILCLIAAKVASVAMPFVLKHVVDDLNTQLDTLEIALVTVPIALLLAYGVIRFANVVLGQVRDTLFGRVTEHAMRRVGLRVFEHLHQLDLAFHLNRRTGGLSRDIERGTTGISFLMRFLVFNIIPTFLELIIVMGVLWFEYRIEFALIILFSVVVYVWFSKVTTDWRTKFIREANDADNQSNTRAIDSLINFETVKYFANEQYEARLYDENLAYWEQARRKNRLTLFFLNAGQMLIVSASMTAMLLLAAYEVSRGVMTIGDFVLVNAFMMQIFVPLNFLGFVYREIKSAMTNIERMFGLLKVKPKVTDLDDAQDLKVSKGIIEFEEVYFSYDERPIINGVNFTVPKGQKLALVGSSGAGKSTLGKLLFRFYDVDQGCILIDGQDIRSVTQHSLRQAIGVVPQDCVLFNTSLLENVRYGRPDATEEQVDEALKLAFLYEFVSQLPDGVHTQVGERGLKLSGGEKQRVAIARTILKQPYILLFDEATSALDSNSEKAVLRAIKNVSAEKTSVVIAHRLSTIVDADIIVVLDKGKIVERGSHKQLLEQQGIYAQLWTIQQHEELA